MHCILHKLLKNTLAPGVSLTSGSSESVINSLIKINVSSNSGWWDEWGM